MQNIPKLNELFDFSQARRVRIRDHWYGLSRLAPIGAMYELVMQESGKLVGRGYLSTSLIAHRVLQISVSAGKTRAFLERLGSATLTDEPYEPFLDHTDDFPLLEILVWSGAHSEQDAVPDIVLHTTSQGEFHTPWQAVLGDKAYCVPGDEIGAALLSLAPALGKAEQRKLLEDTRSQLAESRSGAGTRGPRQLTEAFARREHCWLDVDRVAGDEATSAWKRLARLRQARWRVTNKLPKGFHPYAGGPKARRVGSRIALEVAREGGANFLSIGALAAVHARLQAPEKHQTLSEDRLWADLLSSMPLCFNMFGSLVWSQQQAVNMVQRCWPDLPEGRVRVRFEHSPGRCDPAFLGNKTAFDVAFEISAPTGIIVIGLEIKYHEHAVRAKPPKPAALQRYIEVAERSNVFKPGWQALVIGTELQQLWLDHLLILSMIQHPSRRWLDGRFVLVYPSENPSFRAAAARYRELLCDPKTFEARTLEDMIKRLPNEHALRKRYL